MALSPQFKQHFWNAARNLRAQFQVKLPDKLKGGMVERSFEYLKTVKNDYKAVAVDTYQDIQTRKIRALAIFGGLGTIGYAIKTNPDHESFNNMLRQCNCDLGLVAVPLRNPKSNELITYLWQQKNLGTLRVLNLGFASILWVSNYSDSSDFYETQCKYLQPSYFDYYKQIRDIGIFGSWRVLNYKMMDYDVNDELFSTESA